jgi:ABC-type multidrug transport system fused ATPase/permease subunit
MQPEIEKPSFHLNPDQPIQVKVESVNASWNQVFSTIESDVLCFTHENLLFFRQKNTESSYLSNLTFDVKSGELLAIVGEVGSGKSLLLLTLLRELPNITGKIDTNGEMFYVSQEPWIFSSTIKQNILFGKDYDSQKFNDIIDVCELKDVCHEYSNQFPTGFTYRVQLNQGYCYAAEWRKYNDWR